MEGETTRGRNNSGRNDLGRTEKWAKRPVTKSLLGRIKSYVFWGLLVSKTLIICYILNHNNNVSLFECMLTLNFCLLKMADATALNLCCHFIIHKASGCRCKIIFFAMLLTLFGNKNASLKPEFKKLIKIVWLLNGIKDV